MTDAVHTFLNQGKCFSRQVGNFVDITPHLSQ